MNRTKEILTVILASVYILSFSAVCIFRSSDDYSDAERRVLSQMPEINSESLMSGDFMSEFESYSLDQFPLRDSFRTIKAMSSKYIFANKDNNGFYSSNGYLSQMVYPFSKEKIEKNENVLCEVYSKYIAGTDCSCYASLIPDKNCYLAPLTGHLSGDYEGLREAYKNKLDFCTFIDISDKLSLEDYYRTDQHWRQEKITDIAEALSNGMKSHISTDFVEHTLDVPFYGTYYSQAALIMKPDTLKYLTCDDIDSCIVTSYNTGKPVEKAVYDMKKAHARDPYEMFLCGSDALVTVENPKAIAEKELIIFRDSFSSSLTPLLITGYSKITLIDLRYINKDIIGRFVSFDNQDVLFLYSSLVLNSSVSM